jgi:rsbT co-antagonist protein RsbR
MSAIPEQRTTNVLRDLIESHRAQIEQEWIREMSAATRRDDLMTAAELRSQCGQFLENVARALEVSSDVRSPAWNGTREILSQFSSTRAQQGFTPTETATFVFSLKRPLFEAIRKTYANDPAAIAAALWATTELIDSLGLYTAEVFTKSREAVISRQQEELLELSTPVIKLWEGVLALPLIGTLDSARTQVVMESLLESIVRLNSKIAIIDITGVPTVDTVVAQHLLKTVTAARLMGADCIVSGVRPQIAQTIVHLGINLMDITTKATLSDAFALALQRLGAAVVRNKNGN